MATTKRRMNGQLLMKRNGRKRGRVRRREKRIYIYIKKKRMLSIEILEEK